MRRRLHPTEHDEQVALFAWAAIAQNTVPELKMLFHVPNGGSRNPIEAARLKAAGVKPGVPDLFLPVPRPGWHGLWIEMKAKGGMPTREQAAWLQALRSQGYLTRVCRGADEAISAISHYLE